MGCFEISAVSVWIVECHPVVACNKGEPKTLSGATPERSFVFSPFFPQTEKPVCNTSRKRQSSEGAGTEGDVVQQREWEQKTIRGCAARLHPSHWKDTFSAMLADLVVSTGSLSGGEESLGTGPPTALPALCCVLCCEGAVARRERERERGYSLSARADRLSHGIY